MITKNSIFSARISLENLQTDMELSHYLSWMCDPVVNSMLESRVQEHSMESLINFIALANNSNSEFFFGIFLLSNEEHIGNIRLHKIDKKEKFGEIGLLIGNVNHWGKGYATEAIDLVVKFGHEVLKIMTFGAGCYSNNLGSIRAFEKAGFKFEKLIARKTTVESGNTVDTLRLKLSINEP